LLNLYDGLSLSCIVEANLANLLLYSLHVVCSFQNRSSAKSGRNYEPLFKPVSAARFGATGVPWQLIQLQGPQLGWP
jgi:hypothetical protein